MRIGARCLVGMYSTVCSAAARMRCAVLEAEGIVFFSADVFVEVFVCVCVCVRVYVCICIYYIYMFICMHVFSVLLKR